LGAAAAFAAARRILLRLKPQRLEAEQLMAETGDEVPISRLQRRRFTKKI
jgi:hypothetical protein